MDDIRIVLSFVWMALANTFALGRVLEEVPNVEIELERIVLLQEAIIPIFYFC